MVSGDTEEKDFEHFAYFDSWAKTKSSLDALAKLSQVSKGQKSAWYFRHIVPSEQNKFSIVLPSFQVKLNKKSPDDFDKLSQVSESQFSQQCFCKSQN